MLDKIDFVITWVDGNDEKWKKEKEKYVSRTDNDSRDIRYRDWGLLKYWFRGVEKYADWVNKIYFITWGSIPEWLNTSNPKLEIINHKEYIPSKYLPTFSSHTIELNFHRINQLSEKFVYFNDDVFLLDYVKPEDFFKKNRPVDNCSLNVHCPKKSMIIQKICINDTSIINEHFDMKESIKNNFFKWFNFKNGKELLRTIVLYRCPRFPGFYQPHISQAYLKSTFKEVWDKEKTVLERTCNNKFRAEEDVNQWLFREWQIASGNFEVRNHNFGKTYYIDRDGLIIIKDIERSIKKQKYKVISINDGEMDINDLEKTILRLGNAFKSILNQKSSFEK